MRNVECGCGNDYLLKEVFGPVGNKAKHSYRGSSETNLIKLTNIFKPYEGQVVLVQHFGNLRYSRFDIKNKLFNGPLDKIPQLTLPFIDFIRPSVNPRSLKIIFSNYEYDEENQFTLPHACSTINDFGMVARIVDSKRNVLYENKDLVLEWNEIFAEHGKSLGLIYPDMLVAFGLGRFWQTCDDPVST